MVDVSEPDFWHKPITRRSLLRRSVEVAAGGAVILLFGGCTTERKPISIPQDRVITPSRRSEVIRLTELTESDIKTIARRSIKDFNRVLGLAIPEEEAVSKVNLIGDLKTYQDIIAESEIDYQPTDEKDRPAITTDSYHSRGRQIFLYKGAIDDMTKYLPATERGTKAREDAIEWIVNHEFSHWVTPNYQSAELHSLVYERMFATLAGFGGRQITPDTVVGAKVKAYVDGVRKSTFQVLEEAEAFIIGDFVTKRRGRPQAGSFITASDMFIQPQVDLLLEFLRKLGPNIDDTIKTLARMRTEVRGREKYGRFIGEKFGITENDQLFFSMSLLYAIDTGDRNLYQRLVNRPTQ